jgi:tRNA(Ile)-lysidine synthase
MVPDGTLDRFRSDLDALVPPGTRIGIAVSGGPDSLALLLLAAQARPGEVEAATVDHGFRPESRAEAQTVANICAEVDIPHVTLTIDWETPPTTAIQERARTARYDALAAWMRARNLSTLLTGHHLDDQAETFIMRLNRGSGVTGLAGIRPSTFVPGAPNLKLVRPLLAWHRSALEAVCAEAGATPSDDPSNFDPRHERVRVRLAIADAGWLDVEAVAQSASNLAAANEALDWATDREWDARVTQEDASLVYSVADAPVEIRRRVAARAIAKLATEGPDRLRGSELDRVMNALIAGRAATLRGVLCKSGNSWRFSRAATRKERTAVRNV